MWGEVWPFPRKFSELLFDSELFNGFWHYSVYLSRLLEGGEGVYQCEQEAILPFAECNAVVPYEVTFYTGDMAEAGTDSQVYIKVFGVKGSSSDIPIDKMSERFERGTVDLVKVCSWMYFQKFFGFHKKCETQSFRSWV